MSVIYFVLLISVLLLLLLLLFFDPGTQFPGNEKNTLCNAKKVQKYAMQKKYENQAGMNFTPPPQYYYYAAFNVLVSVIRMKNCRRKQIHQHGKLPVFQVLRRPFLGFSSPIKSCKIWHKRVHH